MRPTIMRVSLNTLVENARAVRERLTVWLGTEPRTRYQLAKMCCVVKADAYGHGALEFARRLEAEKLADFFAVAIVEEARELREGGIETPVLILGGAGEDSLREAVWLKASQAVYTAEDILILEDEAVREGCIAKAHLKLDTGMSRIGVRTMEELEQLLDVWKKQCPHVDMEGCFTHFCVSDSDPEFTRQQYEVFMKMRREVATAGFAPICHAAASTAMLNGDYSCDMVRAGIALYGSCMPEMADELHHAQTLVTKPVRIETIQPGDTVGYGRAFRAERETVVMTLPIGYGDGYPRILSNRADVLVRGKRARVIGRVCMDMIMADVTDIPGVTLSDEVVLMGRQMDECITPDELAERAETIPYEIMLGFGPRIPRVFVD